MQDTRIRYRLLAYLANLLLWSTVVTIIWMLIRFHPNAHRWTGQVSLGVLFMNAALWNLLLWGFSLTVLLYSAKAIYGSLLIRLFIFMLPPLIAVGLVFTLKHDASDLFGFPQAGISFLVMDLLLFLRYYRQPR